MRSRLVLAVLLALAAAPAAARADWTPEPVTFGIGEHANVGVTMSDGTRLSANVYYPTDPLNGLPAKGPFPVVMVQNPYGKDTAGYASGREGGGEASTELGEVPYLIQRGYIDVVVDVRGTGASNGSFDLLDPQQGRDGAELVRWAAKLPDSNGKVGLYGPSYMGIDQFMTAHDLPPNSPLKAMFPIVAGNDLYRDIAFMGGMPGIEFDAAFIGLMTAVETGNPAATDYADPQALAQTEIDHAGGIQQFQVDSTKDIETGGDEAYDEAYWQARNPHNMLADVVRDHVPAFLVGGWFDLFQRGELMNYTGLQNLAARRPIDAPMPPHAAATGRYQLLQGPWYHLDAGTGIDIYRIELAWFDRWLKGIDTGINRTSSPLHAYMLGAKKWVDTAHYPFAEAKPTTYYLGAGSLSPATPTDAAAADTIAYTGAGSPCGRQTDQWGAGGVALAFESAGAGTQPCASDDRTTQPGPGALTYTTAPLASDEVVAGPIDATIYATSTRPELFLEATLEDVAPDGTSAPLTSGALVGSFRALDDAATWLAGNGRPLLPFHPYTRASAKPVSTGEVTRYDIEVFPTLAQLSAGHRLRLTLSTADTPHLLPTVPQGENLAGGVYAVQRNAKAASFLEVPLAPAGAFAPCSICH